MLNLLSKKVSLLSALFLLVVLFTISASINPLIDGKDGYSLLELQLAFDKQAGIEIINNWGAEGRAIYNRYCFVDYIYAVSYSVFLASLLAFLIRKKALKSTPFKAILPFTLLAGTCDWLENTMEFVFIQNPTEFPDNLFFLHSIVALVKWASILIAVIAIVLLLTRNKPLTQ